MDKIFLTVRQASELLNINEKKIYNLIQNKLLPATMITGKWLFDKNELENFVSAKCLENVEKNNIQMSKILLTSGSDDALVKNIEKMYNIQNEDYIMYYSTVGSSKGIGFVNSNKCDISFSHIYSGKNGDYNFTYINENFNINDFAIINLFYRDIGFVSKKENVKNFKNIIDNRFRFINRQTGSGIRIFIDELIQRENLLVDDIIGYGNEVDSHFEIASAIKSDQADVGMTTRYVSNLFGLNFSFIQKERFDAIIKKETYFYKKIQYLINLLNKNSFFSNKLPGYDFNDTGKILYKN